MKKIALIACSKRKLGADTPDKKFRAKDIYIGNSFNRSKNTGVTMYGCEDYFIISAKHHLLDKNAEIAYYDKTLNSMNKNEKKEWAEVVLKQLANKFDLVHDKFFIFGGSNYYKFLLPHLNCTVFEYENSNSILLNRPIVILEARLLRNREHLNTVSDTKPGYYKWWATYEALDILLSKLDVDFSNISPYLEIKDCLYCIYVGIAVKESLRRRLNWHINQQHTDSAVKNGALSTLRQTISSVVAHDQYNEQETNKFIDLLKIEYFELPYEIRSAEAKQEIHKIERKLMESSLRILTNHEHHKPQANEIKTK